MRRFNPEKELYKIQHGNKNKIIVGVIALLVVLAIGSTYALYQVRYSKRIIYTKVAPFSIKDLNLAVYVDGVQQNEFPKKDNNLTFIDLVCENGVTISGWDNDIWGLKILSPILLPNKCNAYFTNEEKITKEIQYSGHEEEYEAPKDGVYKIELWGASGGSVTGETYNDGGNGGYTSGIITLSLGDKLYFYVGEKGNSSNIKATFNGGGAGALNDGQCASGGGATDVRLKQGSTWNELDSLKSRIMVAGGGAGSERTYPPGAAGGLESTSSNGNENIATQTSGYQFGIGQNGLYGGNASGAGGGYYGGRAGLYLNSAGGSSFISGHLGCNAIAEASTEGAISHTGEPIHYSKKVFSNTKMVDGQGYYWTDSRQTYIGMPTIDGTNIMVGNTGNGYARITYLGPSQ